jgi:hypothetical protein
MHRKRPVYNTHVQAEAARREQCAIDFHAPAEPPVGQAEEPKPEYRITTGWIDTADRTRTWNLLDPQGTKIAEVATKRDGSNLASFLNFVDTGGHLRALFLSQAKGRGRGR